MHGLLWLALGRLEVAGALEIKQLEGLEMAHEAHRRLGGTCTPGVGCIPVSVLAEESPARGNNCPNTDKLWDVVSRLSETVGRHDAALADKLKHPKLACIQANLVSLVGQVELAMRLANTHSELARLRIMHANAKATLDLVAEYRSA